MELTQVLRVLADHVHVAEDVRDTLHEAIDVEAELRGEPKRAKVVADANQAEHDREVTELEARLAALKGDAG